MPNPPFRLEMSVRDYECDMQGIVNNAVYQNYLEHTRHQYLQNLGLSFAKITQRGINMVVIRAELDYKSSLKADDSFFVTAEFERLSKLRFLFHQNIVRLPDEKLIVAAKIFCTSLNEKGRPCVPEELELL